VEAGGRHLGVPVLRIRDQMVTREPDMTRLIGRLESAGYVGRVRGTEDRRVVYVHITDAGLDLLACLDPQVEALHRGQFAGLAPGELRVLSTLLFRATAGDGVGKRGGPR
jgi:DNA-binding MarR family transcriptional regulator